MDIKSLLNWLKIIGVVSGIVLAGLNGEFAKDQSDKDALVTDKNLAELQRAVYDLHKRIAQMEGAAAQREKYWSARRLASTRLDAASAPAPEAEPAPAAAVLPDRPPAPLPVKRPRMDIKRLRVRSSE